MPPGGTCRHCNKKMPKVKIKEHIQHEHWDLLFMVKCDCCGNTMPKKSMENHEKICHYCLYCDLVVSASSIDIHIAGAHHAIYRSLKKTRKEHFESGKRECLQQSYIDSCTGCKMKILKTSLEKHGIEFHPPVRPIRIPFVQPDVKYLRRRSLKTLYQHRRSADIFFEVENNTKVAAHKCILASDSVEFFRMFYGNPDERKDIKLGVTSLGGLRVFLQSFYFDFMSITEKNVAEIIYLGNLYKANKCTQACVKFLSGILRTENVLTILELSLLYNLETLREVCVKKIIVKGNALIKMDSFYHTNRDVLRQFLSTDFLGRDELTVFGACIEWAGESCNKQNIDSSVLSNLRLELGDCFNLIRLDSMSPLLFVQYEVMYAEMFTQNELIQLANAIEKQTVDYPRAATLKIPSPTKKQPKSHTSIENSFDKVESLFGDEKTADVFFVFEIGCTEPKRIPAHKCILAQSSTKFDEMFYGPNKVTGDIHISLDWVDAFSVFLQAFYWKAMPLTIDNVAEVMYFADEYKAPKCLSNCEGFLVTHLSDDNVFLAFKLSYLYHLTELYETCVGKIDKQYRLLLTKNEFLDCSHDTVKHILLIDIELREEYVIFEACIKWAKRACEKSNMNPSAENLVEKLDDILDLIQFTLMTSTEFMKCHINYGEILNTDRLKVIFKKNIGS